MSRDTSSASSHGATDELTRVRIEWLRREAPRASFFQLVYLLETWTGSATPGETVHPSEELMRFRPSESLAFALTDIISLETVTRAKRERYLVTGAFMGLYGASSPLPSPYLDELDREGAEVKRDFLDLFNHRLHSLLYRIWRQNRLERQYTGSISDPITRLLLSILGLDVAALETTPSADGIELSVGWLLRWGGLLAQSPRSAHTLEVLLQDNVHPAARVEPFVLRQVTLREEDITRLQRDLLVLGRREGNFTLGRRVMDRTGRFRIWIGPVDFLTLESFLPGAPRMRRIQRLIDLYLMDPLDYELVVVLPREEIKGLRLSRHNRSALRRSTWVGTPASPYVHVIIPGRSSFSPRLQALPAKDPGLAPDPRTPSGVTHGAL